MPLSSSLLFSFPLVIRYVWGMVMHCSAGDDDANRSVSAAHAVSAGVLSFLFLSPGTTFIESFSHLHPDIYNSL